MYIEQANCSPRESGIYIVVSNRSRSIVLKKFPGSHMLWGLCIKVVQYHALTTPNLRKFSSEKTISKMNWLCIESH